MFSFRQNSKYTRIKILLCIIVFSIPQTSYPFNPLKIPSLITTSKGANKAYKLQDKLVLIKNVILSDLKIYSKSENITLLLRKAVNENKISCGDEFFYYKQFNKFKNGDELLLNCLKCEVCDLDNFIDIANKSQLHKEIITKHLHLNLPQVNQKVGKLTENVMDKYFQNSGWTKIEGEIGRNGIDGLYVKIDKNKNIRDVLIVESKFNKSQLSTTNYGIQMSKEWALKKIQNLNKKHPNEKCYEQIENYINKDIYRARLWSLNVQDTTMSISLQKVVSKNDRVMITPLRGGEKGKINYSGNETISMENPTNDFQKKVIEWYNHELDQI
jgi:hypothetical protein